MAIVERRALGMVESVFAIANSMGGFRTGRTIMLRGRLEASRLEVALRRVTEVFPLLRAKIAHSWRGVEFVVDDHVEALPLEIHARQDDDHWKAVLEAEINRGYREDDLLWRLIYLEPSQGSDRCEMLLMMCHSICDGMSGPSLVHHLLTAYTEALEGRPMLPGRDQALSPPVDRMLTQHSQVARVARFTESLLRTTVPAWRPRLIDVNPLRRVEPESRRTEYELDRWDEEATARFMARCRQEDTTVHGALCAAMLSSTLPLLESNRRDLSCYSNVSLRPYCVPPVDPRQFGCFVYWIQTRHRLHSETRFWELARECGDTVKASFRREGFPPSIVPGTARAFRIGTRLAMKNTGRNRFAGRTDSVGVSNLGVMRLDSEYGPVEVLESQAITSQHLIGVCAGMLAHTFRDRLFFSFPYATVAMDRATARALLDRFHAGMADVTTAQGDTPVAVFGEQAERFEFAV